MLDVQGLHFRAAFLQSLRLFFIRHRFLEVDTPVRQPVVIPESAIEPLSSEGWLLQTSPELCMKRLLARGCEKIFQLCHCYRKGERGRLHLEEFTMLEWYRTGCDYRDMMTDCEALLVFLLQELVADNDLSQLLQPGSWAETLELSWERLTVADAFERYSDISLSQAMAEDMFDEILVEQVEPHLGIQQPLFLYDYPAELASLAKVKDDNSSIAERFELYIDGVEIANGFSELTDSRQQRLRFENEVELIKERTKKTVSLPERFLGELDGIGSAAGIALGVDRLCMLLLGERKISAAVSFYRDDFL